ncbi:Uncharacterised protein [Shigella sonnei]|nr:Uncharacterised protein [Shigella sonnei]SJH79284.1 Uncharacterised protein [Shigella sonnei]
MNAVGSDRQIPAPLGMTDIVLNWLHFSFRRACIQRCFRFEVSVNQLIFNLDFQVVNRLLTFRDHFLQGSFVLGMAVRTSLGEVIKRITNFMVGIEFAFGVLHFWHMAVDTGHVVFTVNARCPGFIFRVLRFQHWRFRQGVSPVREGNFVVILLHIFDFHAVIPREFNRFVFAVEVILHMALTANHRLLVETSGFLKRFTNGFHRASRIRTGKG